MPAPNPIVILCPGITLAQAQQALQQQMPGAVLTQVVDPVRYTVTGSGQGDQQIHLLKSLEQAGMIQSWSIGPQD